MMILSLMKRFFDTVNEDWQSPIADEMAARWLDRDVTVRCVRASANFVFHVQTSGRQYFLRFNHSSERQVESIVAELDYIDHLSRRGIRAARPVRSLSGNYVESVPTAMGVFHGILFEALPGSHLEFDCLDARGFEMWGKTLGKIHAASEGFEARGRPDWADHVAMAKQVIPKTEERAWEELDFLEKTLGELPVSEISFGLIHYDFELDNIKWDGGEPGILDFDDCARYWFAADIAFALRDLFDDRADQVNFESEALLAFLRGYRSAKPIEDEAIRTIPLFLRLHNLFTFARLVRSLADGPLPDEPQWTADLRQHLAGILDGYREAFLDYPILRFVG